MIQRKSEILTGSKKIIPDNEIYLIFKVMRSKFLALNGRDFVKGLILAVLTAVITFAYDALQSGTLFEVGVLKKVGMMALAALLAYLLKNLLTNTKGEILTAEK